MGGIGALACFTTVGMKWMHFETRADFKALQDEIEDTLKHIRDIKRMGCNISRFYEELREDIQTIQSCAAMFQQLHRQIPHLKTTQDVDGWDSRTLSAVLHEWELPTCARMVSDHKIDGRAFLHVLGEKDFQDLGIKCDLTLRRLQEVQTLLKSSGKVLLRFDQFGLKLKQALDEVAKHISAMKDKYRYP